MKKFGMLAYLTATLGLLCASLANAEANRVGGKFGVFGNVGYSSYAMGDTNKNIDDIKDTMNWFSNNMPNYSGSAPSNIHGGLTYGGGVQYALTDYFAIGVEVGALTASPIKYSYSFDVPAYDPNYPGQFTTQNISYSSEGNVFSIEAGPLIRGYWPIGDRLLLNGTLGLEYVSLNGYEKFNAPGAADNITFSGSTWGVKASIGGEVFLSDVISLGLDFGYRLAKITEFQTSGIPSDQIIISGGSIDYSGLLFQGGIRLYF